MMDNNVGPVIMEKKQYIKRMLEEYLCDGFTYKELTKNKALETIEKIKEGVYELLCAKHKHALKENEKTYFEKGYKQCTCNIQFYGALKAHKPVVSHV